MEELKQQLSKFQQSQSIQDKHIKLSFLKLNDIQQKFHYIKHPYKPQIYLFTKIRIELLSFIFEYLDIQELLTFRLVNKASSQLFNLIINVKIKDYELKRETIQQEASSIELLPYFQELKSKYVEIKNKLKSIEPIAFRHYVSAKYIPDFFKEILLFISYLFFDFSDYYGVGIGLLHRPEKVKELINFDISLISDKQLQLLQGINQVSRIKCQNYCDPCLYLYDFLSIIVELRQTEYYQLLNQKLLITQQYETLQKYQHWLFN